MISRLVAWLDTHFVPDWRSSWKWPEVQLAAVAPAVITVTAEHWDVILKLIEFLPENIWIRGVVIGLVILSTILLPVFTRLLDTEKKTDDQAV